LQERYNGICVFPIYQHTCAFQIASFVGFEGFDGEVVAPAIGVKGKLDTAACVFFIDAKAMFTHVRPP
jgi:hypothetical protein